MKSLVRLDIGLMGASVAALAIGLALPLASAWDDAEPQTEPEAKFEANLASTAGQAETAAEPGDASAPCPSFDERFASAFGSAANTTRKVAAVQEHEDVALQLPDLEAPVPGETADAPATLPAPVTSVPAVIDRKERRLRAAEGPVSLPLDSDNHTAIYDISARTVYLPNGQKLEAHSGLGSRLDNPRFIRTKMQGPTPPNVYNLSLRERLFHGVRAIRLNPVDDAKMFGRDGILAHTYMLGPNGQSNGCVSFRNYSAFLDAFLKGEVKRLVVVEHLTPSTTGVKIRSASGT